MHGTDPHATLDAGTVGDDAAPDAAARVPAAAPGAPATEPGCAADPPALTPRYADLGRLGTGGMAVVHRVHDRLLDRRVAMKMLAEALARDAPARARFTREARLLAALRHPGIVPVYELGTLPDGRPFFTMDEVRGESFAERLRAGGTSLAAGVAVLARVAECVAYAHAAGVVHRDLKPANVMLGEAGEVRVVDWGIARAGASDAGVGAAGAAAPGGAALGSAAPGGAAGGDAGATRLGAVVGTPAYMAPEQAGGAPGAVGPAADVYALGAILYTLLAGRPPYLGGDPAEVRAGPPPAVRALAGDGAPEELVALCAQAMARAPAARPDAAAVGDALNAWLAGTQRLARARAAMEAARARAPAADAARAEADAARRAWIARPAPGLHASDEENAAHWRLDDAATELDVRASRLEEEVLQGLRGALAEAPELGEARAALAERLVAALHVAEDHGDGDAARAAADALREQAPALPAPSRARVAAALDGAGTLTLRTEPPDAEVHLARFVTRDRRLVEEPVGSLGRAPLVDVPLGHGSWMLTVRAPGHADVRLPVFLRRGERWSRLAPGEGTPRALRLPRSGELGPDDVYVPAGWFRSPPPAIGWPSTRTWTESFVIGRFPVTHRAYVAYLEDLVARGARDEALARVPTTGAPGWRGAYTLVGDRFELGTDDDGDPWDLDQPAFLLGPAGACAYAAWRSARTGFAWRLPTTAEWTHAAGGVDGRAYPMGDHVDPAWMHVLGSYPTLRPVDPVGAHPMDVSCFGVRDLVGGVADIVDDGLPGAPDFAIRGGTWAWAPVQARLGAPRRPIAATHRAWGQGFRLVRSYP